MDIPAGQFPPGGFPPGTGLFIRCPLSACQWQHDDVPLVEGTFSDAWEALLAQNVALEDVIRTHLETHTLLEWAREVTRLQTQLEAQARDAPIAAVLVRRLGGQAPISDAELAAETGTLVREAVPFGFILRVAA
jgi:hypothetical protein